MPFAIPQPDCPECKAEGVVSPTVLSGMSTTDLAFSEFFDAQGAAHYHDPNTILGDYSCPKGHSGTIAIPRRCWCGWSSDGAN